MIIHKIRVTQINKCDRFSQIDTYMRYVLALQNVSYGEYSTCNYSTGGYLSFQKLIKTILIIIISA